MFAAFAQSTMSHAAIHDENEWLIVSYIGADQHILKVSRFTDHRKHRVAPPLREIVADGLTLGATSLVLAHNHPSGNAMPSRQDFEFTRLLVRLLHPIGIRVRDHIVMTQSSYFSFRAQGLL